MRICYGLMGMLCGSAALTGAVGPAFGQDTSGPTPSFSDSDRVFQSGHAQALARLDAWRARRADPAQRDLRVQSRSMFRGLERSDAADLARARFPEILARDAGELLVLPSGLRITQYTGTTTAAVETATGKPMGVLMSEAPIALPSADGPRPIELGLSKEGERYLPRRPGRPYSIPERADGAVRLQTSGVVFRLAGASPREGLVRENRLFYASVGGDSSDVDYILEPRSSGVSAAWQIRSDRAPEIYRWTFELPAGHRMELLTRTQGSARSQEGARVVDGAGATVATVTPPLAYDSDGTHLPVDLGLSGSDLTLTVRHQGADVAYPLILDPQVAEVWATAYGFENCGDSVNGTGGAWSPWQNYNGGSAYLHGCDSPNHQWGYGLYVTQFNGGYYTSGSSAWWGWRAPSESFIDYVGWSNTRHTPAYNYTNATYAFAGILGNGWHAYNEWGNAAHFSFGQWANDDVDDTWAIFGLRLGDLGSGTYYGGQAGLEGAYIIVNDRYAPGDIHLNSFEPDLGSSTIGSAYRETPWMNVDVVPPKLSAHAWDRGLGLQRITLVDVNDRWELWDGYTSSCNGSRSNPCRNSHDTDVSWARGAYQLPEGVTAVKLKATDINDKHGYGGDTATRTPWGEYGYLNIKNDRSAPTVSTVAGTLAAADGSFISDQDYTLSVTAADGANTGDLRDARSGVRSITVSVNGAIAATTGEASCPPSVPNSCSRSLSWTFNHSDHNIGPGGVFEISIVARDQLGHASAPTNLRVYRGGLSFSQFGAEGSPTGTLTNSYMAPGTCQPSTSNGYYCNTTSNLSAQQAAGEPSLCGTCAGTSTITPGRSGWGVSDNDPDMFYSDRFNGASGLDVQRVSLQVPWDIMLRPASSIHRRRLVDWMIALGIANDARTNDPNGPRPKLKPMIRFYRDGPIPSGADYENAVRQFVDAFNGTVKDYVAWNEVDLEMAAGMPAARAAEFYMRLDKICDRPETQCVVGAGSFTDSNKLVYGDGSSRAYIDQFKTALGGYPVEFWAVHAYKNFVVSRSEQLSLLNEFIRATSTSKQRKATEGAPIWLTEQGPLLTQESSDPQIHQESTSDRTSLNTRLDNFLREISRSDRNLYKRVKRFYYYAWQGDDRCTLPNDNTCHDSGLLELRQTGVRFAPRRPFYATYKAYTNPTP